MVVIGAPPTSAAAVPPFPASPWQATHFCAKIFAPCAAVPLPGGRPPPSGEALMSQALMSASEIGCPRLGVCASAEETLRSAASANLGVDMADLAFRVDRPAGDG